MVTSSSQISGGANSSIDQSGVHQPSRSSHHSPNGPPNRSSATPRLAPATPGEQQQQSASSGPAVVSRYILPTYRQASSSSSLSSSVSHHPNTSSSPAIHPLNASLPDILHSHMVPQIPRLRQNQRRHGGGDPRHGRERHRSEGDRHRQTHHGRGERRRTQSSSSHTHDNCACKEPCVKCVVTLTSFRWVLVVLSILGVCCVVSGIVLAALHAAGSSFLFLAVMFIGLGILLVIVVSVGWKCTPRGHEPLHALFHIGQFGRGGSRERHRRRRHRHRDGNWFGGVFYPEFQYRRPPPSYAASMQDYQNQSLQELSNNTNTTRHERNDSLPGSPPPSYHSRTSTIHSGMNIIMQGDSLPNSRPPTYRSRAPSRRPSLPRQESLPQQEVGSSDLLPQNTNDQDDEFLHVAVVGESVTEGTTGGDSDQTLAAAGTRTYSHGSPSSIHRTTEISQHGDEFSNTSQPSLPSPHNTTQVFPTTVSSHVSPSQPGADESVAISSNQNYPNAEYSPSTRMADSTVVVITNQPMSSSLPQTTSATSTSFTPGTSHFTGPFPEAGNFESEAQQLEQVLEPLDGMEETGGGIDNLGANISSDSTEHYDTHL